MDQLTRAVYLRNLPNRLSLFRIFLVPLLVVVIITKYSPILALAIFWIAAVTDWLDGYIARRTNQITHLGQLLDPIADKLLILAVFVSLVGVSKGRVPSWMVVIFMGRELAVTGLRAIAASNKLIVPADSLGKYKTVAQVLAISLILANLSPHINLSPFDRIALWLALVLAIVSGVNYFYRFRDIFKP